jgi:hypothetical protein
MADNNNAAKTAAVMSSAAAVASAIALIKGQPVQAGQEIKFPPEIIELLISITENGVQTLDRLDQLVQLLGSLSLGTQGWPTNRTHIQSVRVLFPVAAQAVQLPDFEVPDGMALQIVAWPTNANIVYIGESGPSAINVNQVTPLAAGGVIGYNVKNAKVLWASAVAANDAISVTCER